MSCGEKELRGVVLIPEMPSVERAERTGYPSHSIRQWPVCPVCGAETDALYRNMDGDIVGCEACVRTVDAWEEEEEPE